MADSQNTQEEQQRLELEKLPRISWLGYTLFHWKGAYLSEPMIRDLSYINTHLNPQPDDVLVTSYPKTGTTWLMALTFAILDSGSRKAFPPKSIGDDDDLLLRFNPHQLFTRLETEFRQENANFHSEKAFSRHLWTTHLPHDLLPDAARRSSCKVVYIARNPGDVVVSFWHFANRHTTDPRWPLEEVFEAFINGMKPYGSFFDHVLGYWEKRDGLLFLTYEDLRADPEMQVRRLADYLGVPLGLEEVGEVVRRCSIERIRKAEVSKEGGGNMHGFPYSSFFRKGVVGDRKSFLTEGMMKRLDEMMENKFKDSGLHFKAE